MSDNRNMVIFAISAVFIFMGWHFLYEAPRAKEQAALVAAQKQAPAASQGASQVPTAPLVLSREQALKAAPRVTFKNDKVKGSIKTLGGIIDDLTLLKYQETTEKNSAHIVLLRPQETKEAFYSTFGWSGSTVHALPNEMTQWTADRAELTPETPVTLSWDNGKGIRFEQKIELDQDYLFTVTQKVTNATGEVIQLSPTSILTQGYTPQTQSNMAVHEGAVGYLNSKLQEFSLEDLRKKGTIDFGSTGGWIGLGDKFWFSALIPDQKVSMTASFKSPKTDLYQTTMTGSSLEIAPGTSVEYKSHFFSGAKELKVLDKYEETLQVNHFDLVVDFGWFYFITKPTFYLLNFLYEKLGNMGIGILILTVLFKLAMFPLANKSYRSMNKMKALQPMMERIKTRYDHDKLKMNQELMNLYKKEKVNPMAGCLPMLVQIPVFFALYKVLMVSIEMRHAPFYGWIQDLSAMDPTTIFNLFGLIPWTPPSFLMFGAWPLIMGATMFLQQKMSPQPADPAQAKVMMIMPVMFTFMMAGFPAGLLIYWTWSNVLGIAQQWLIGRMEPAK